MARFKVGDRVADPQWPYKGLPHISQFGTVQAHHSEQRLDVKWDDGSTSYPMEQGGVVPAQATNSEWQELEFQ